MKQILAVFLEHMIVIHQELVKLSLALQNQTISII